MSQLQAGASVLSAAGAAAFGAGWQINHWRGDPNEQERVEKSTRSARLAWSALRAATSLAEVDAVPPLDSWDRA